MRKIRLLFPLAFLGLTAGLLLAPSEGASFKAEEGSSLESSEVFSSDSAVYSEYATDDEKREMEENLEALKEKVEEFKSTQLFMLVSDIIVIAYSLWGIMDKILTRKRDAQLHATACSIDDFARSIETEASQLKAAVDSIAKKYGKTESEFAEVREGLESSKNQFVHAIKEVMDLEKKFAVLTAAFLELCASNEELVKTGAYKRVEKIIKGGGNDAQE